MIGRFSFLSISLVFVWALGLYGQSDYELRDKIRGIYDLKNGLRICEEVLRPKTTKLPKRKGHSRRTRKIIKISPHLTDSEAAWEYYSQFAKEYAILSGKSIQQNEFLEQGYFTGEIQEHLVDQLLQALDAAKTTPIVVEDYEEFYSHNAFSGDFEKYLNKSYKYFMLDERLNNILRAIAISIEKPIQECIGSAWEIVNVRAWKTLPNTGCAAGGWHTDGFVPQALKIMIYPLGANPTMGSIAFQLEGEEEIFHLQRGGWILFKNSEITHRAIAPQPGMGDRPAIELTIAPAICFDPTPISAGLNAHYPKYPWLKPKGFYNPLDDRNEIVGINIGGGSGWSTPGWINLEEQPSALNPYGFKLTPNCRFPVKDGSVKTIYTSHNLEHLNLPTAYRVLAEVHRALQDGGDFVIKIPDYDKILDSWVKGDNSYFDANWNFGSTVPTWHNKGLSDCIEHRASVILCSYFNKAHGNQFSPQCTPHAPGAYLGPAVMSVTELGQLLEEHPTPSKIASALREHIKSNQPDWVDFCHQSAWSRQELEVLLNEFGFEVVTFDINAIIGSFTGKIVDIANMTNISTYCWARKKTSGL